MPVGHRIARVSSHGVDSHVVRRDALHAVSIWKKNKKNSRPMMISKQIVSPFVAVVSPKLELGAFLCADCKPSQTLVMRFSAM